MVWYSHPVFKNTVIEVNLLILSLYGILELVNFCVQFI